MLRLNQPSRLLFPVVPVQTYSSHPYMNSYSWYQSYFPAFGNIARNSVVYTPLSSVSLYPTTPGIVVECTATSNGSTVLTCAPGISSSSATATNGACLSSSAEVTFSLTGGVSMATDVREPRTTFNSSETLGSGSVGVAGNFSNYYRSLYHSQISNNYPWHASYAFQPSFARPSGYLYSSQLVGHYYYNAMVQSVQVPFHQFLHPVPVQVYWRHPCTESYGQFQSHANNVANSNVHSKVVTAAAPSSTLPLIAQDTNVEPPGMNNHSTVVSCAHVSTSEPTLSSTPFSEMSKLSVETTSDTCLCSSAEVRFSLDGTDCNTTADMTEIKTTSSSSENLWPDTREMEAPAPCNTSVSTESCSFVKPTLTVTTTSLVTSGSRETQAFEMNKAAVAPFRSFTPVQLSLIELAESHSPDMPPGVQRRMKSKNRQTVLSEKLSDRRVTVGTSGLTVLYCPPVQAPASASPVTKLDSLYTDEEIYPVSDEEKSNRVDPKATFSPAGTVQSDQSKPLTTRLRWRRNDAIEHPESSGNLSYLSSLVQQPLTIGPSVVTANSKVEKSTSARRSRRKRQRKGSGISDKLRLSQQPCSKLSLQVKASSTKDATNKKTASTKTSPATISSYTASLTKCSTSSSAVMSTDNKRTVVSSRSCSVVTSMYVSKCSWNSATSIPVKESSISCVTESVSSRVNTVRLSPLTYSKATDQPSSETEVLVNCQSNVTTVAAHTPDIVDGEIGEALVACSGIGTTDHSVVSDTAAGSGGGGEVTESHKDSEDYTEIPEFLPELLLFSEDESFLSPTFCTTESKSLRTGSVGDVRLRATSAAVSHDDVIDLQSPVLHTNPVPDVTCHAVTSAVKTHAETVKQPAVSSSSERSDGPERSRGTRRKRKRRYRETLPSPSETIVIDDEDFIVIDEVGEIGSEKVDIADIRRKKKRFCGQISSTESKESDHGKIYVFSLLFLFSLHLCL